MNALRCACGLGSSGGDLRVGLLLVALRAGVWTVLGTELLGRMGLLRFGPVALWWTPLLVLGAAGSARRLRAGPVRARLPALGFVEWLLAALCAGACGAALVQALLAPPNTWDALGYHLPRQVYWMQHGTVDPWLTYQWRQLEMPPFAEFAGLHLMILSGSDRLANLVEWSAFGLALVAVSLVARDLGASRAGQLLAAACAATLPAAFHQASSAKNDIVVGLWTVMLAFWTLGIFAERALDAAGALRIGATLGLLILTKGTGPIYAVPILAVALVGVLRHERRRAAGFVVMVAGVTLALNLGHAGRNLRYFGSPIGARSAPYYNATVGPRALASGLLRNAALHLGSSREDLNAWLYTRILGLHRRLGLDVDDPRTTYLDARFAIYHWPEKEDFAGAPVHLFLAGLVLVGLAFVRPGPGAGYRWLIAALPFAAALLFCLLLRWQPWHARLHISLFFLLAPVLGWVALVPPIRWAGVLAMGAAAVGLVPALRGEARALLGPTTIVGDDRTHLLFRYRPEIEAGTLAAARFVARRAPASVALWLTPDDWEYPLQRILRDALGDRVRFVEFDGWSPVEDLRGEAADLVVTFGVATPRLTQRTTGAVYDLAAQFTPYAVYTRPAEARAIDLATMPFVGWQEGVGLTPIERFGPSNAEIVPRRAGLGPRTRLAFTTEAAGRVHFRVVGRPVQPTALTVRVRLDETPLRDWSFPPGVDTEAEVDLDTPPGKHALVLEYVDWQALGAEVPRAMLFSKIQLLEATRGGRARP